MKKTEELRRKQKLERYKASPIYPYKKDWRPSYNHTINFSSALPNYYIVG
jgi:hypothetical protein